MMLRSLKPRWGTRPKRRRMLDVLRSVEVGEVMETQVEAVPTAMRLAALARLFTGRPHHRFPVLDPTGALCGMLTRRDLARVLAEDATLCPTASDLATTILVTVYPDEPVSTAALCLVAYKLRCLPVIARDYPRRLLGIVWRQDVVRAYVEVCRGRFRTPCNHAERYRSARLAGEHRPGWTTAPG